MKSSLSSNDKKVDEKMSEDNTRSYAFDIHTEEEKAMNHLEKFGFVVIEQALAKDEVKHATNYCGQIFASSILD